QHCMRAAPGRRAGARWRAAPPAVAPLSQWGGGDPAQAALLLRSRGRRLPRRRRARRGLRDDAGRSARRTARSHLQGPAARRRSADPAGDAGGHRSEAGTAGGMGLGERARPPEGDPLATRRRDPHRAPGCGLDSARAEREVPRREVQAGKYRRAGARTRSRRAAVIRVGLARTLPSYTGLRPPFGPGKPYPELTALLGDRAAEGPPNSAYAAVRGALQGLGLDAERFDPAQWNPPGALVPRGPR